MGSLTIKSNEPNELCVVCRVALGSLMDPTRLLCVSFIMCYEIPWSPKKRCSWTTNAYGYSSWP